MNWSPIIVLACALTFVASNAAGQVSPEVKEQLEKIGRKVDTLATSAIYTPMQAKPPYAGVRVQREVKFGSDPKQDLDVFSPEGAAGKALPVLIMVHGGGFVAGDKSIDENGNPSAFYDNIMLWAVKNGMVGVNVNYRLAPQYKFPAAQQDISAAVAWVQNNIAGFGGDPHNLRMMGHSAGGAHVASYVAHPELGPNGDTGLVKAVFSSGSYDFGAPHAYFGDDAAAHSSIPGLVGTQVPFMVIVEENDPQSFHVQAGKLMQAVCATGNCPPFLMVRDHNHMSGVYSINSPDHSLSDPILQFLRQ